jgi:catechol 2,3-dioxygenase-like lactoylglutathione lyase family enzyme
MKRFHVHIAVTNIDSSIDFYSKLFGVAPTKRQDDYAKWMLEDPRINFAISSRGHTAGVNHFGFQVDSSEELTLIRQLAEAASPGDVLNQGDSTCCYANSEKHWTIDPQGLAWEHFYTMSDALEFGADTAKQTGACCIPVRSSKQDSPSANTACCIPGSSLEIKSSCCA